MKETTEHTPIAKLKISYPEPRLDQYTIWEEGNRIPVAVVHGAGLRQREVAEFIVRAANAYGPLVKACEEMRRTFGPATGREISDVTRRELAPWIPMLDAALAAAGKEQP